MTPENIRVFLDSNILFSASYKENNRFLLFWRMQGVTPVTSLYVIGEVERNIDRQGHIERFHALLAKTSIVSAEDLRVIPPGIVLPEKDRPILASALAASLEYLVTGDENHFGNLYGRRVGTVTIQSPADFLKQQAHRLDQSGSRTI